MRQYFKVASAIIPIILARLCGLIQVPFYTMSSYMPSRRVQTGSSAFLLPPIPSRSITSPIYGPTTGALLAKAAMVPKKSPNSTMMPYSSTQKPIRAHRSNMRVSPPKKAAVPFAFCFLAKKSSVFCGPIIMVSPIRKRICLSGGEARLGYRSRKQVTARFGGVQGGSHTFPIASLAGSKSQPNRG